MNRINRTPLHIALLTALGISAAVSPAVAAVEEYTEDDTVLDVREHVDGFRIGSDGVVTVNVAGRGSLKSSQQVTLGANAGGHGTLRLSGAGARLNLDNQADMHVGAAGSGLLRIEGGGKATIAGDVIAESDEGEQERAGRIEVSGAGSSLTANRLLASSLLRVEQGGQISTQSGQLRDSYSGYATAVITGEGSQWTNAGLLDVRAGLDVLDGAQVSTGTLQIAGRMGNGGVTSSDPEQVRVSGTGSTLKASGGINIDALVGGNYGVLAVSDGGHVEAGEEFTLGAMGFLVLGGGFSGWDPMAGGAQWDDPRAPGTLDDSAILMSNLSGGLVFNHTGNVTLDNAIRSDQSGPAWTGGFLISEAGTTTLTGDLTEFGGTLFVRGGTLVIDSDMYAGGEGYTGIGDIMPTQALMVTGGTLVLNGTAGFLHEIDDLTGAMIARTAWATVTDSGVLAGNATVGSTWVADGGTLSPGHDGIGQITIEGNLFFNARGLGEEHVDTKAFYDVDLLGGGGADLVKVTGKAYIGHGAEVPGQQGDTGVRVTALDPVTSYRNGQRYTILEADGGISGGFDDVTSNSAFIVPTLVQGDNVVQLDIALNAEGGEDPSEPGNSTPIVFGRVASTGNQIATAAGLDSLHQEGEALALYNHLLMLDEAAALEAFDQLSGELHASKRALLLEDRFLRDGIRQRLRPDTSMAERGGTVWVAGTGNGRSQSGDGSAAAVRDHRQGMIVGHDWTFGEGWTVGLAGGPETLRQQIRERSATTRVNARHGGLYAGFRSGGAWAQGGASYADYTVKTQRAFGNGPQGEQVLSARHGAHAVSVFSEGGFDIEMTETLTLTPYLALAHTRLTTAAVEEAGGSAALAIDASKDEVWTTTSGVRMAWDIHAGQRDMARVEGGLAWQNASGEVRADSTHRFVVGSDRFTVRGLPLARNVGIAELGVSLKPTDNSRLSLLADGRVGNGVREFGVQANWRVTF